MADQVIKVRIEGDSTNLERGIRRSQGVVGKSLDFIRQRFVVTFGDIQRLVSSAFNQIQESARLRGTEQALRQSLNAQGILFDQYIDKLKEVSDSQIANADLIASSSRAIALGINAADIPALLDRAREASIQLGTDFTQAFDDIATGIGRASPLILDNLGITVNLTEEYGKAAEALGKTAAALTVAEKRQALLKAVLDQGTDSTQSFAESQDDLSVALNQANAQLDNFKRTAGDVGGAVLLGLAALTSRVASGFVLLIRAVTFAVASLLELGSKIPILGIQLEEAAESTRRFEIRLGGLADRLIEFANETTTTADAALAVALGFEKVGESLDPLPRKLDDTAAGLKEVGEETEEAAEQTEDFVEALQEESTALTRVVAQQREVAAAIRITTAAYDKLVQSQGEAAALNAALAGGGELVQGGTRLRLPGGGSRLVGRRGLTTTAGTFSFDAQGRIQTLPDGTIVRPNA